ncbi:MAG: cation diffusion facilitator family transporter [Ferruginibacter sp.]
MLLTQATSNLALQRRLAAVAVLLLAIKLYAWYLTNSVAILTDALESIVNVAAAFIGLYSLSVSSRPKDMDHPYGHGKVEFITAAIEGTLISVAGIFVIYKAILNLLHPGELARLDIGIILMAGTAVINYIAGGISIKTGKKTNSMALIAGGKHLRSDTYTTIGIIAGLGLLYFTRIAWIDGAVAIIFALIIIYTGYSILRTSIAGIMDEADVKLIRQLVLTLNSRRSINWIDLHNLRIIKYGPTLHLDCHLTVPWYFNVNEAHKEIDLLSGLVREQYGETVELFVHSDGCLPTSCPICKKGDCPVRQKEFIKTITWTMENISSNQKHSLDTPT